MIKKTLFIFFVLGLIVLTGCKKEVEDKILTTEYSFKVFDENKEPIESNVIIKGGTSYNGISTSDSWISTSTQQNKSLKIFYWNDNHYVMDKETFVYFNSKPKEKLYFDKYHKFADLEVTHMGEIKEEDSIIDLDIKFNNGGFNLDRVCLKYSSNIYTVTLDKEKTLIPQRYWVDGYQDLDKCYDLRIWNNATDYYYKSYYNETLSLSFDVRTFYPVQEYIEFIIIDRDRIPEEFDYNVEDTQGNDVGIEDYVYEVRS